MNARKHVPALFFDSVRRQPRERLFGAPKGDSFSWISSEAARTAVLEIAAGLIDAGLDPGDRAAILSENRPEWLLAAFAIQAAGGADVPVYATLPAEQTGFLLRDAGARVAFVSNAVQARKVAAVRDRLPDLRLVVVFDADPGARLPDGVIALAALRARGAARLADEPGAVDARLEALTPATLATIIYTSGTTGTPKGARLTHGNFCHNVAGSLTRFCFETGQRALSFLPLAHVLERMVVYAYLEMGLSIAFVRGPEQIRDALPTIRPQVFVTVPKVLEMAAARIEETIDARAGFARLAGRRALRWAGAAADDLVAGRRPRGLAAARLDLADRLVLHRIRERLGGELKFMIAGGAALSPRIARFFWAAGVPVYEGYGMTETSPVIAVNAPGAVRLGTVGRPLPNVEVRIAPDGEVLVRGPSVTQGYWERPDETAQLFDDTGFLRTGDLGRLDPDGFLALVGRKKEILVLSTGKNVAARAVEQTLEESPFISRAIAVGDERPALGVLIVPEAERLLSWAAEQGIGARELDELLGHDAVRRLFAAEMERLQTRVPAFEKARRFEFLLEPPSEENGLLTPTQKVRRHEVLARYGDLVDRMYE